MVTSYCSKPYYLPLSPDDDPVIFVDFYYIRMSIFLITGACVGSLALIWALRVLCLYNQNRGRISPFVISLLLSDLLELILNPLLVSHMFSAPCTFQVLTGARFCGFQFHQLVALESILTLKYPSVAHLFSPKSSIILCILVWMIGIGLQLIAGVFTYLYFLVYFVLCVLPVIVSGITFVVTCLASPDPNPPTDRRPELLVLSVAMFTQFILYMPFSVNHFIRVPFMLDCLMSMRLISEPILCVLICRETRMIKTTQQQTDHTQ